MCALFLCLCVCVLFERCAYVHGCFSCMYICTPIMPGALEVRRGYKIPRKWSYSCESPCGSSARTSTLNSSAISPVHSTCVDAQHHYSSSYAHQNSMRYNPSVWLKIKVNNKSILEAELHNPSTWKVETGVSEFEAKQQGLVFKKKKSVAELWILLSGRTLV